MEKKNIKIAVIEDDKNLRFLVSQRLKSEGFDVVEAADGTSAEEVILKEQPHLVLLDWMLPGKTGDVICNNIREKGFANTVIMITAKSQEVDKIDAYNFGVNDYITKPFSMDLLVALLENKLKYVMGSGEKSDVITFGDLEHHPHIHLVVKDGRKVELTILENRILLFFLKNIDRVVNRDELMLEVWGYNNAEVNTRTLDMHIVRLRKKIETDPENPVFLQTVRGIGYRFNIKN